MISKEEVAKRLKEDFNYPEYMIDEIVEKINGFDKQLGAEFEDWYKNGVLSERAIEGFTLPTLIEEFRMKTIGAFLTMDWLLKEPEEAIEALDFGYDILE